MKTMKIRTQLSALALAAAVAVPVVLGAGGIAGAATASNCFSTSKSASVQHSNASSQDDARLTLSATVCVAGGKISSVSKSISHSQPGSNVTYLSGSSSAVAVLGIEDIDGQATFRLERSLRNDCRETISAHITAKVTSGGQIAWTTSSKDATFLNIAAAATCYHT